MILEGKIIHILSYDRKFTGRIVRLFEAVYPNKNTFLVGLDDEIPPELREAFDSGKAVRRKGDVLSLVKEILAGEDKYSLIIIHCVERITYPLFAPGNGIPIPAVGIFWGGDLYFYRRLYTWKTLCKVARGRMFLKVLVNRFGFLRRLVYRSNFRGLRNLRYCGNLLDGEFRMLQEAFPTLFNAASFEFSYGWIDEAVAFDPEKRKNAKNILVGNSAFLTNNHIDILEKLSRIPLNGRKVVVPLGYGDVGCVPKIIAIGRSLLKDAFYPEEKFLPLEEYNKIHASCGIGIFGGLRQMALANVLGMLLLGGKLFFFKDSVLYQLLKRKGFVIFSIEDDLKGDCCFDPLSDEAIGNNRSVMYRYYSKDAVIAKITRMVDAVN